MAIPGIIVLIVGCFAIDAWDKSRKRKAQIAINLENMRKKELSNIELKNIEYKQMVQDTDRVVKVDPLLEEWYKNLIKE